MTDRIRYGLSILGLLLMIGSIGMKYRLDAQEAHSWVLWAEQFGDTHKVSKIQVEEKCYIVIEAWTHNGNGLVMHVEPSPCPTRHP